MPVVTRGQVLGAGGVPALVFYNQQLGILLDLYALSFQIFDVSDDTKYITPVQVFPSTPDAKAPVDIAGVDRLGIGRYAATWTVPSMAPAGMYEVRWFFQRAATLGGPFNVDVSSPPAPDGPVIEVRQPFEVLQAGVVPLTTPFYGSFQGLRNEGVSAGVTSDAKLLGAIVRASRYVEMITQRSFRPTYADQQHNGTGGTILLLNDVVIALETMNFATSPLFPSDLNVQPDFFRVYNRHLTDGLFSPDDREDPRVELFVSSADLASVRPLTFSRLIYPRGQKNVEIRGVFGYTDPDGSPFGVTPPEIERVTNLLALRYLPKLTDCNRDTILQKYRITSEKTRDQSYDLESNSALRRVGRFTGDAEIDFVLARYMRPPIFGAA